MGSMVQIKGKIYFYTIDECDTARRLDIPTRKITLKGVSEKIGLQGYSPPIQF